MLKACSRCSEHKALSAFKPDARFSSGRRPECRMCAAPAMKEQQKRYRNSVNGRAVRLKQGRRYFNSKEGREARRESARRVRYKVKLVVLSHYSRGVPKCSCCKDTHIEFLTIDHINGSGRKHRDELKKQGRSFYGWLKHNGYPKGFRVLCFNCNFAVHVFGACPHKKEARRAAKLSS